jgi:hypothetical protein
MDLRQLLDGSHWSLLCFTPERAERLQVMLYEINVARGEALPITHIYFPPGVLWNGQQCNAVFIRKSDLDGRTLVAGLRQHFGYEYPEPQSDLFTLGVTEEDDALLDRVGLFGKKK